MSLALQTRNQKAALEFDSTWYERAEKLTLQTASEMTFDAPVTLSHGSDDFALVLHMPSGRSVSLDGDIRIIPNDYIKRTVDVEVRCGSIIYDRPAVQRLAADSVEVELSSGLSLTFRDEGDSRTTTVALSAEPILAKRLKSFEFCAALEESATIEVNGRQLAIGQPTAVGPRLLAHIEILRTLAELFKHLGVLGRDVHDSRLIGGCPPRAQWRRRVL
ncbi:MAG TPA: hypothetical protein VNZ66_11865 [Aeromicrobium sp.]|nr:hypothetical protein [Aeromicrobium sp.]